MSSIGYAYCTHYSYGTFTKTAGSNITFASGVAAPFINLSSNAAFSNETSVAFTFVKSSRFCGSNAGWTRARNAGTAPQDNGKCGNNSLSAVEPTIIRPSC